MTQLPKIVGLRLAAPQNSEHPDPDLLTAYMEGSLAGKERDWLLNHVSGCAECRQVIVFAMPESSAEAFPAPAPTRDSWLHMPVLRWGALAACVVTVAATILIHKREQPPQNPVQVALQAPLTGPAVQATVPPQATAKDTISQAKAKKATRKTAVSHEETAPQELASANAPATPPNVPVSANAAASNVMQKSETLDVQAEAAPSPSGWSPRVDQEGKARNSAPAAKSAPLFTARPSTETAASTIGGVANMTDFHAPDWRLSRDGLPERSFAPGQWEKLQVDHKTGFRVIAARAMEVWIGGSGGVLYHSEDVGLHWTRIIPVSRNAVLTQDITAIDFADHMHGSIHTADAQTWVTSDAGKTWEIQ